MILHSTQLPRGTYFDTFTYDQMFLFCGWSFGLNIGEPIHRYELFAFIQTHFGNKTEESLQAGIQYSPYWDNIYRTGTYSLNSIGKAAIYNIFGKKHMPINRVTKFKLWKYFKNQKFLIEIDAKIYESLYTKKNRLTTYIDEEMIRATEAIYYLDTLGVNYVTESNGNPTRFWNWIIQDNDYYWEDKDIVG